MFPETVNYRSFFYALMFPETVNYRSFFYALMFQESKLSVIFYALMFQENGTLRWSLRPVFIVH